MSVTVLLASGTEETTVAAKDFALGDDGTLSLLDKPASDETGDEIAVYAVGWQRVRLDAPAAE